MIRINLIPMEIRAARARRQRIRIWTAATLVSAAAAGVPLALGLVAEAEAGELVVESTTLKEELDGLRSEHGRAMGEGKELQGQIERAKALRSKRAWSALLALIGRCLPEDAWLTLVATDPAAPTGGDRRGPRRPGETRPRDRDQETEGPANVTIEAPRRLKINGYALSHEQLYEFMGALKHTGVFTEVTLVRSGLDRLYDGKAVGFELECGW